MAIVTERASGFERVAVVLWLVVVCTNKYTANIKTTTSSSSI